MPDDKGISIPATISINGVDWDVTPEDFKLRKNQFPKRDSSSANRKDSEFLRAKSARFNAIKELVHLANTRESAQYSFQLNKQRQDNLIESISTSLGAKIRLLTIKREGKEADFAAKQWLAKQRVNEL